ncbi:MAG: AmmeMemoRadiSam system protein B [Acidobacteriia bacterium]|nr:AmmeMemoRadiSam system protein B [Terriglobia bacterium]
MKRRSAIFTFVLFALSFSVCQCELAQPAGSLKSGDRPAAVAGQFYPEQPEELRSLLQQLFSKAIPSKNLKDVLAIIAPHAGYPFSGEVAASAFNQIDAGKAYDNIFVIGPSHNVGFEGAAVYTRGDYWTPLGRIAVNTSLGAELVKKSKLFLGRADAHETEHSIEVELPFLQFVLKKNFQIVPIVIGGGSLATYAEMARALRPYFNSRNLFVISTDFSHYPAYEDARKIDAASGKAVLTNSTSELVKTIQANENQHIPNLVTSMCGLAGVLTLLDMTQHDSRLAYTSIEYKNSGDTGLTDRQRVVGYYAIAVSLRSDPPQTAFTLTKKDREDLLRVARTAAEQFVRERRGPKIDDSGFSENIKAHVGAFVTLRKNNDLRGCLGRFESQEPLYRLVEQLAIASATEDVRFPPVEPPELSSLEYEISVLTPMRRIQSIDEIVLGKHGIYMQKGSKSGVFLPQVATETGWNKMQFLGHCAQDKAGLGWNGWKDAEIYVFEALVFDEKSIAQR